MSAAAPPVIFEPAYYDRLHRVEQRHGWFVGLRAIATTFLEAEGVDRPAVFLDAGCGTGAVLSDVAARLGARRLVGVDLSRDALTHCAALGLRQVAVAGVESLPFADGAVDIVHSADVLQHLPAGADDAFVREAYRVLRPGGLLYMRTMRRHGEGGPRAGDPHYHQYDLDQMAHLVRNAGFDVRRLTTVNILPALKGRVGRLRRARRPPTTAGIPQASPGEPLNSVLKWLLMLEGRVLSWTNWRVPYGLSIVCVARKGPVPSAVEGLHP